MSIRQPWTGSPWLLIAPSLAVLGALFALPLIYFFVISFWQMDLFRLVPALTLENYVVALTKHGTSLVRTLGIGGVVAAICVLLGFATGYLIRFRGGRFGEAVLFLVLITMFGGYLMKIYAWKTILGNQGVINSGLISAGVIAQPFEWLLYSPSAIIVTMVHFLLPFAVLPIYGALRGIRDVELEAARDLGAGTWTVLRTVILPRAHFGMMAAFTICFLLTIGDYITPILVGGGSAGFYGQMIAPQFGTMFDWPLGAAMGFVLMGAAIATVAILGFVTGRVLKQ